MMQHTLFTYTLCPENHVTPDRKTTDCYHNTVSYFLPKTTKLSQAFISKFPLWIDNLKAITIANKGKPIYNKID